MAFTKGHPKKGGKTKGTQNKVNKETREAYKQLVENNLDKMDGWLSRVAARDPEKAFDILIKLSEYFIPKLNRTEIKAQIEDTTVKSYKITAYNGEGNQA